MPAPAVYERVCSSLLHGWRFWSLANGEPTVRPAKAEKHEMTHGLLTESYAKANAKASHTESPARPRLARQIKRVPNQKGVEEGKTRWFCSACMAGFQEETRIAPATCPQGHLAMVPDEFTGTAE